MCMSTNQLDTITEHGNTAGERYFLIDCNNFYCSCERLFRPDLAKKPVIVLSNNDGCFISRSDEVKHLGIPMGAPYFKYKEEVERMGAEIFSANFTLYGDISNRVMNILRSYGSQIEVYSIDEAFLYFKGIDDKSLIKMAEEIHYKIKKWVGIPVSIGIGNTKTLAKLANKVARQKNPYKTNVYNIMYAPNVDDVLRTLPVGLVWGIGRKSEEYLTYHGKKTVYDLKYAADKWLQNKMGIVGVRIAWELREFSCIALEDVRPMKKGITSSRSFGRPITTLKELRESIATYVSRAAEKLREDKCLAGCIQVYVLTDRFKQENYYSNSFTVPIPAPTAYTPMLSKCAIAGLQRIYKPRQRYKKAGIMLTGIVPDNQQQGNLFHDKTETDRQMKLMNAFDAINTRFGRHVLRFAAEGAIQLWSAKSEQRSPSYTTEWKRLVSVR